MGRKIIFLVCFLPTSLSEAQRWEYARYLVSYVYFTATPYDKNDTSKSWGVEHYWFEGGKDSIFYKKEDVLKRDSTYSEYLQRITGIENKIQYQGVDAFNLFGSIGWEMVTCQDTVNHMTPNLMYKNTECYFKRVVE